MTAVAGESGDLLPNAETASNGQAGSKQFRLKNHHPGIQTQHAPAPLTPAPPAPAPQAPLGGICPFLLQSREEGGEGGKQVGRWDLRVPGAPPSLGGCLAPE